MGNSHKKPQIICTQNTPNVFPGAILKLNSDGTVEDFGFQLPDKMRPGYEVTHGNMAEFWNGIMDRNLKPNTPAWRTLTSAIDKHFQLRYGKCKIIKSDNTFELKLETEVDVVNVPADFKAAFYFKRGHQYVACGFDNYTLECTLNENYSKMMEKIKDYLNLHVDKFEVNQQYCMVFSQTKARQAFFHEGHEGTYSIQNQARVKPIQNVGFLLTFNAGKTNHSTATSSDQEMQIALSVVKFVRKGHKKVKVYSAPGLKAALGLKSAESSHEDDGPPRLEIIESGDGVRSMEWNDVRPQKWENERADAETTER